MSTIREALHHAACVALLLAAAVPAAAQTADILYRCHSTPRFDVVVVIAHDCRNNFQVAGRLAIYLPPKARTRNILPQGTTRYFSFAKPIASFYLPHIDRASTVYSKLSP